MTSDEEEIATMRADAEATPGYDYTWFLIIIKILGLASMLASTLIMRDMCQKLQRAGTTSTRSFGQRITLTQSCLFCLSVGDFFSAFFVQFLSTWMVPSFIEVSMASGSVTSCTVQGVFAHLFYGMSVFSNASLAVAYSLIVKRGWNDQNKERYKMPFTIIPVIIALVMAVVPLPGRNYNYNGAFYCDITASPLGCDHDDVPTDCVRGHDARWMLLYVGIVPFMVAFVIIVVAVVLLVHSVWTQERRMDRYSRGAPGRSMTIQTTRQGIYYILAFGVTWIPWYIYAILEFERGYIPKSLAVIHYITMPLQGVFNALVYFRPKYKSRRANNPSESRTASTLRVLRISLPAVKCSCCGDCARPTPNETNTDATARGVGESEDKAQKKGGELIVRELVEERKEKDEMAEDPKKESNDAPERGIVVKAKSVRFSNAV